jgi:hypothetical protein
MGYTLKFEHPQFPEGQEFGIPNLGLVENGSSIELDEEQERLFVLERGISVEDAFKDNSIVTLSGSSTIPADELSQLLPAPEETSDTGDTSVPSNPVNSPNSVFNTVSHESGDN